MADETPAFDINAFNEFTRGTLPDVLGIEFLEVTPQRLVGRMPVGRQVHQPFGLLHGGASVVLAETLASMGGWLNIDQGRQSAVGLEINANHLRSVRDGHVTGVATPIHLGRSTHVWDIRITDDNDKLVCVSRCTIAVVSQKPD
ncbi:MAG TPA: hotdog fold thioesterase [Herpetosiphonaceae bacterium]|nr:hotdog fold thioesterase [Herpetosiphonaceae bacterium]